MHRTDPNRVVRLGRDDVPDVVSVLSEAFFDYPVMRFVLGSADDYRGRLERLVRFFVMARVLHDEVMLGVRGSGGMDAAALVSDSRSGPGPSRLDELREETWAELGVGARRRYEAFGAAASQFSPGVEHLHLNMIGVRHAAQGRGSGRALLEAVHVLSESDPTSSGVTLTTEVESNVDLYEHFGYEVIGRAEVESAFTTWFMYRPDRVEVIE